MGETVAGEAFGLELIWDFNINRYVRNIRPAGQDAGAGFVFGATDKGIYRIGRRGELKWRVEAGGRVADVLPLDAAGRRLMFAAGYEPARERNDQCTIGIIEDGGHIKSTRTIEGIFELHPIREGILAAGVEGRIYLLSPELDEIWRAEAGSHVYSVTETNEGTIAAATIRGHVLKLDKKGRELARIQLPDDAMRVMRVEDDGGPDLLVSTSRNSFFALDDSLRVLWHRLTPIEYNVGLSARLDGRGLVVGSAMDWFWDETAVVTAYDLEGIPVSAPVAFPHGVDTLSTVADAGGDELLVTADDCGRVALFRVVSRPREGGSPPGAPGLLDLLAGDDPEGRCWGLFWAARCPGLADDALRLNLDRLERPTLFDFLWAAVKGGAGRDAVTAVLGRFQRGEVRGREPHVFRGDVTPPLGAGLVARWEKAWLERIAAALERRAA